MRLISVIDDDESICRSTRLLIESHGFRAVSFETAEGFLKSGLLCNTSCLIVDLQMPGINGLQLQSRLANEGCRTPIIFITSNDNRLCRQRAMQGGAVAYLCKPFSDTTLVQSIHSALRQDKSDATVK